MDRVQIDDGMDVALAWEEAAARARTKTKPTSHVRPFFSLWLLHAAGVSSVLLNAASMRRIWMELGFPHYIQNILIAESIQKDINIPLVIANRPKGG